MVILGKLKIWKFPFYVIAQFLGAFAGAAAVFGLYYGKWSVIYYHKAPFFLILLRNIFAPCPRNWYSSSVKLVFLSLSQMLSWTSQAVFCRWQESMQQVTFLPRTLPDTCQSSEASLIRSVLVNLTQLRSAPHHSSNLPFKPRKGGQIVNATLIAPYSLRTPPLSAWFGSNDPFRGIHRFNSAPFAVGLAHLKLITAECNINIWACVFFSGSKCHHPLQSNPHLPCKKKRV